MVFVAVGQVRVSLGHVRAEAWFCVKTVEVHPEYAARSMSLTIFREHVKIQADKDAFRPRRSSLIEIAVKNLGRVTLTLMDAVYSITKKASRDTRRGRAMTVARYFEKTQKMPAKDEIKTKVRNGKVVQPTGAKFRSLRVQGLIRLT